MYICHLTRQIKRIDDKHYKVLYQTQQSNVFDFNVLCIKLLGLAPKFHKSYYIYIDDHYLFSILKTAS